uniref:Brix domain-containing protein n=1 Tax=Polytomella parva TaxID=51329 RepID=A0A7S0V6G4_9CHLO
MLRRNIRLRKEYLYRKGLQGNEKAEYERKRIIRKALEEGKPIPTELRREEKRLRKEVELEDDNTAVVRDNVDDEYAHAGEIDPKVLITTSRDPSSRLTQFAKEMKLVVPNSQRINRGGMVLPELVETCRNSDFTDIVILHEHRGEPDGIVVCHLPFGPTAYFGLFNTVLRHDIGQKKEVGTISEAYPHLVFDRMDSSLGQRTMNVLKHLFPVPKEDSKRVVTFANRSDYISFRHFTYSMPRGTTSVELSECGPRFELKLYQIRLGTVDQEHAENEWVLRSYTRKQNAVMEATAAEKKEAAEKKLAGGAKKA